MALPDPAGLSVPAASAVMAVAAVVVGFAGARLTRAAKELADRTRLTEAFVGLLLLGSATSLPEIATTTIAASHGNADLAVSNLLGGVAAQVAILVLADAVAPGPLTARATSPVVLLQGVALVVMLALVALAVSVGEVSLGRTGLWTPLFVVAYLGLLVLLKRTRTRAAWETGEEPGPDEVAGDHRPWARLVLTLAASAAAILVAGFALARSAEAIGEGTHLGSSFVGVSLLALATSLPEVSTSLTAGRLGLPTMAFSNILGTNLLEVAILFVADLSYPGPVLDEVGAFGVAAAALGILLTCIYLVGLLERRERSFLRLGVDSWLVLAAYGTGMALLYSVR